LGRGVPFDSSIHDGKLEPLKPVVECLKSATVNDCRLCFEPLPVSRLPAELLSYFCLRGIKGVLKIVL
jgi:hypothetical protein